MSGSELHVYDTTLRDGAQQEGLQLSVQDKLAIARHLDRLGVAYIEGGWPGAVPKDTEFFARARSELTLETATLVAFGATRRAGSSAASDPQVAALLASGAPVITLVAKSHRKHVESALRTTGEENLAMVSDTVSLLRREGRRVFLDAEHFFDGWLADAGYALEVVAAAEQAGAEVVALCDTNGGMLPPAVADVLAAVAADVGVRLGVHCHNDTGCAVANSLAAVEAGAVQVQGTLNGYGERTGNADLLSIIANLELKQGRQVLPPGRLREATGIAHAVSEITNVPPYSRQPYVGASAFAHKAGLHASAIKVNPDLYQHTDPRDVGNDMRMLVSDMAGRASVQLKGRELGFDLDDGRAAAVVAAVKELEARGYTFEAADASFELLLREHLDGARPVLWQVESWRVITEARDAVTGAQSGVQDAGAGQARQVDVTEATVKIVAGGSRRVATGEGNGPVNALDHALRLALQPVYPEIQRLELIDYRVRILDAAHGTDAVTRVLIETSDSQTSWETVGVAANIIAASWEALSDGIVFGLLRHGVTAR